MISRKSITKYQLIFRHLFLCKYVERQLCETWKCYQQIKEMNLRKALTPLFSLRQKMFHFLQNFEYYMMFEVLEPNWHILEQQLKTVIFF